MSKLVKAIKHPVKAVQHVAIMLLGHPFELYLHQLSAKKKTDQSYANEMVTIEALLKKLGIKDGFAVDVAASDGLTQSSTYKLFLNGWKGFCMEMDPVKFSKLAFLYRQFEDVRLQKTRVTPNNIASCLNAAEVPQKFDFLNMDIDSYDLRVIESMLEEGFSPSLISMEVNEKIPPEIFFTVEFDEHHYWQVDHFFGCSLNASNEILSDYGYVLIKLEWNNAMFIHKETAKNLDIPTLTVKEAYNLGYKERSQRKQMFRWNKDVDYWLDEDPEKAAEEICKYFSKYKGMFTCRVQ
jgi:hypothetical protein